MISGIFPNGEIIASGRIEQLQNIVGDSTIKRIKQNQKFNKSKIYIQKKQEIIKEPIDFCNIQITLPENIELEVNRRITQPSYLESIRKLPLPSIEVEENILNKNKALKTHYKGIQQIQQMGFLDQTIRQKPKNQQQQQPQQQQLPQQNGGGGGGYFYGAGQQQQQNNDKYAQYRNQITELKNFTGISDDDIAVFIIQKYPNDLEKQVQAYQVQQQEIRKTTVNKQKNRTEDMIKEFQNITNASYQDASIYINKHGDLISALTQYQKDKADMTAQKIQAMKQGTDLSDQQAQFYLESCNFDVQQAQAMYQQNK